jgi:hypothetical protein
MIRADVLNRCRKMQCTARNKVQMAVKRASVKKNKLKTGNSKPKSKNKIVNAVRIVPASVFLCLCVRSLMRC